MRKIQYSIWKNETGNAGGKAKNDVLDILSESGFELSYHPSDKRIIRVIQQFLSLSRIGKADILVIQYPAIDFRILPFVIKRLRKVDVSIALIHDLRGIQGLGTEDNIDEIYYLNHFKYLIVHNRYMADYLTANGYQGKIVNLNLFDYLHDLNRQIKESRGDGSISFAGNLDKSSFLKNVNKIENRRFIVFGRKPTYDLSAISNIEYGGMLPSDEIVYQLEGDYGLVWDGDSLDGCSGPNGNYLRYNNPHKLSLYIAAGKPVITWREAAIADFVIEKKIGVVVDSLRELSEINLSDQYEEYRNNVLEIKKQIAEGYYTRTALNKIMKETNSI